MDGSTAILWWIFCGLIGGAIGATRGRVGAGILLGALLGPIGIIASLCLGSQKDTQKKVTKKCPRCAERIQKAAQVCRYCGAGVVQLKCPHCQSSFYLPDIPIGSSIECGNCSGVFTLTDN